MAMLDTPEYRQGQQGEEAVRKWLEGRGFWILNAANVNPGGAAMLTRNGERLILPDLQAAKRGTPARFVEVKTKTKVTWCKRLRRWEHGVACRNWEHYLECEEVFDMPGYLCIIETEKGLIFEAPLQLLNTTRERSRMDGEWHWFIDRDLMDVYDGRDFMPIFEPIVPRAWRTLSAPPAPTHRQLRLEL